MSAFRTGMGKHCCVHLYIGVICCLLWSACRKTDAPAPQLLPEANQWILDSMRVYYYWNNALPSNPAPDPDARKFFSGLLNKADRFSYLLDPDHPLTAYSSFAYYGLEYALMQVKEAGNKWVGVISLVVPGGSASIQGLKRGDMFTAVNDTELSTTTIEDIQQWLREGNGVTLKTVHLQNGKLVNDTSIMLPPTHFTEQPVYLAKIFNTGGTKTGYLFYNYFDSRFDQQLLDSLYKLKQGGIRQLILDLRYNPGGDVSSAALIGAVTTSVKPDQTFVIYKANSNGGTIKTSFQQALEDSPYEQYTFEALAPYRLSLDKLIVLTSGSTASAAELIVNNLAPYIQIVQIGSTTMGKDMGSFAIADQRESPRVNYTLYPLIFRLYNAMGKGEYGSGLVPGTKADEFSRLPLTELGDEQDVLLEKALENAGGRTARSVTTRMYSGSEVIVSSTYRSRITPPVIKKRRTN